MSDDNFPIPAHGMPLETDPAPLVNHVPTDLAPPAQFAAPAPTPAAPNPANQPPVDSTREIVETVVFVVVLVLLLKSFVAEAFVIPTGSMAETLWGYQKVVKCPECDILFPVNCSNEVEPPDGGRDKQYHVQNCVCPNCFKRITLMQAAQGGAAPAFAADDGTVLDPGPTSGDRVLVAKFLYDLFGVNPNRLDVVVFKFPGNSGAASEPKFPYSGPFKNHVPMNYIKRLIGLPGETIAICNGKLYVLPPEKSPKQDDLKEAGNAEALWEHRFMHINDPQTIDLFRKEPSSFQIIRKSPENLLAMKRLVYDNDHPARDLKDPAYRRWRPEVEKSWTEDQSNGFRHTAAADQPQSWLRYHHRLREHNEDQRIHPTMGYNSNSRNSGDESAWVGDLILECEVTAEKAEGVFILELSKGPERYRAQWNLADGFCTLSRVGLNADGGLEGIAGKAVGMDNSKKTALSSGTHRVRFANVDQRLTVWVDDRLVFGDGVLYDVPSPPQPTENDLQPASIGVKGASVQVKHIKLFHDTYYDSQTSLDYKSKIPPVLTMYVQPDHFLCLGDNNFNSSDSRMWGLVPRRLMLGRALTVYYPFYFPWWPLSSQVNRVGLIH